MRHFKIKGARITNAGLYAKEISSTPKMVTVEITGTFFPFHTIPGQEPYRIGRAGREYLTELMVGQVRKFWTSGTRAGFEVGNNHQIIETWYTDD